MAQLGPEVKVKISHRGASPGGLQNASPVLAEGALETGGPGSFMANWAKIVNWGGLVIPKTENRKPDVIGTWRSLVSAGLLWEQEVGGSNPPVPTSYFKYLSIHQLPVASR